MKKTYVCLFASILALFWVSGCASISVQPGRDTTTDLKPLKVYVGSFDTTRGEFNVDRDGAELADFKVNLQKMLTTGITVDLTKRLIPAEASSGRWPREQAWLIRGEFVKVNQGSRLLRGTVGFGAGATKLETRFEVYNLADGSRQPFLTFGTTGGSNAEPGILPSLATDPLSLLIDAAGGAGNVAHGVTEDTARTAREVTAKLSDYMYHHGWITEDQWIKPKQTDD